jgi:hypothetical protein
MITLTRVRRRFPEAQEAPGHNGTEYYVHCPKRHRKGPYNFKLSINAETGAFCCHDCGWSGSAFQEWFDGVDEWFGNLSVEPVQPLPSSVGRHARVMDEWMDGVPSPGRIQPLAELAADHPAWNYLRDERGFDEGEIRAFGPERALYYCQSGGFTRGGGTNGGRIIFPIYMHGHLKGWQARQIERKFDGPDGAPSHKEVWNGESWTRYDWNRRSGKFQDQIKGIPKYNTSAGMQRSQCLYGFDSALAFRSVVVVEGPLDALAVGPEAAATLGGASLGQAKLIAACWESAVILRDPNVNADDKSFRRFLDALRAIPVAHLQLPDGKDPGSTPREVIWTCIAETLETLQPKTHV